MFDTSRIKKILGHVICDVNLQVYFRVIWDTDKRSVVRGQEVMANETMLLAEYIKKLEETDPDEKARLIQHMPGIASAIEF